MRTTGRRLRQWLWLPAVMVAAFAGPAAGRGDVPPEQPKSQSQAHSQAREIRVPELPQQARDTLDLIRGGGPYPYQRDGITFGNYEQRLPTAQRGYYREYTVTTPRVQHRGARRIVVGCEHQRPSPQPAGPLRLAQCRGGGELYYTADHYRSFRRIVE